MFPTLEYGRHFGGERKISGYKPPGNKKHLPTPQTMLPPCLLEAQIASFLAPKFVFCYLIEVMIYKGRLTSK